MQRAKGFLLSPKIPSLLSVGTEGIRMFQEEPRIFFGPCLPFVMLPAEPQGWHMALLHLLFLKNNDSTVLPEF